MGIDMRGFKVVYKERVYNALNMCWRYNDTPPEIEAEEKGIAKPKFFNGCYPERRRGSDSSA